MAVTLDSLLASREARVAFQKSLLERYPYDTLICLTVIMPGNVKRNSQSLIVAQAALSALLDRFGTDIKWMGTRDLETGFEAYLVTPITPGPAKKALCAIEDTHPLGRLFDMDVITKDGPMSRSSIGLEPRKCLLCGNEARVCMRSHAHTQEELLSKINQMLEDYVR